MLAPKTRPARLQQNAAEAQEIEAQVGDAGGDAENGGDGEVITDDQMLRERMSLEETRRLKLEMEQHMRDIEHYYRRRITLYLQDSDEELDVVKPGLSTASLQSLKKVIQTIQAHQEKADEVYSLLRPSAWFYEEDEERFEAWYGNLNEGIETLLEQVSNQEKSEASTGSEPQSPSFNTAPRASSEQYVPSTVEPLKLDHFIGLPGTYRPFRTRFRLVMKKSRIDESLQAEHLLRCLSGEPLRITLMVDLEEREALKRMWHQLDERYGNEQCEYQHHVTELQKLSTYPVCRTDADLRELYYTFSEHIFAIRRISRSNETGEDYKTILCGLLPDYLRRKMYKTMLKRPSEYTLNNMMVMVGDQVGLSNLESATSGKEVLRASSGFGREQGNPWTKSRAEAERRAHACVGRLAEVQQEEPYRAGMLFDRSREARVNSVTVGQETFSVPGPVARACYPVNKREHSQQTGNHYTFRSCSVPPITSYVSDMVEEAIRDQSATGGHTQGWGSMVGSENSTPHMFQVNVAKPAGTKGFNPGSSSPWASQTVSLNLKTDSSCVFCGADHGSLNCRAFELGNNYMEILKSQSRCYNCFQKDHTLLYCTAESTCKAPGCRVTAKHCPFFCGRFKAQTKGAYAGLVACSVDAMGNFDNARLHTILFLLVHPESGSETLVRGFLDGGCTDTFLLESTARKAGLPGLANRIKFLLSAFGQNTVQGEGALVKAHFKSLDGKYISPLITCITRDSLIQDVDSFTLTDQQRISIQRGGYALSDSGASINGKLPIDMVIGQDLYYQLIKGAPVHCSDGLVLIDTVFGYALGGPVKSAVGGTKKHMNYLKCQLLGGKGKFIDIDNLTDGIAPKSAIPQGCIPPEDCRAEEEVNCFPCLFCGSDHSPVNCDLFSDREQFMLVLKGQGRCFNCFGTDHIVYFCPKPSMCQDYDCKRRGKHSPFMCRSTVNCASEVTTTEVTGLHVRATSGFRMSVEDEQRDIRRLADVETLGIRPEDKEEDPILEQFNAEVARDEEAKRVVIKLPWQHKRKKQLRSNFTHSLDRTNSLYEKLSKPSKEETFDEYNKIMEEQVKMGILEKVADLGTVTEVRQRLEVDPYYYDHYLPCHEESQIHYLPHQAVIKASSKKLRVVYDASARPFKAAFSLNDCLETGPSLIQSLADILTRFRLRKCAYIADIAKAFLQIVVDPRDRDSLRLLWFEADHVIVYRFNRLPFGLSSSPFILAATLKYLLESSNLSTEEVMIVLKAFYVDDLVSSKDSEEEVLVERAKVKEVLEEASMELCKWNSNSIVLKGLFSEGQDTLSEVESVLGMVWDTRQDVIHVNNSRILERLGNRNTKEELYSVIAQVFDPMGLLSPYVLIAKGLLHKACLAKLDWKGKLPTILLKEWELWKADLPKISQVKYDRFISFEGATEYELHGFCDASGEGLAACVYLVSKGKGKVQSRLLRCRTRVNSSKPMSMPRKEMCAAVLLALVMHMVVEAVKDLNVTKKAYYTDSMNALHWIVSDHLNWPVFVANRIKQVRELTDPRSWLYINTTENPADLPSRGCLIDTLKDHTLFREGPRFLVTGEEQCLGKMDLTDMPEGCRRELPKVVLAVSSVTEIEPRLNLRALVDTTNTNSYYEVMRKTRRIYKAVALMRAKRVPVDPQSWSMKRLEIDWCRTVQHEHFEKEIAYCVEEKGRNDKGKPQLVRSLSLFWDAETKLLRCATRLQEAQIGYEASNPILIPKVDEFTTWLITAIHQRVGHVGVKQTLSALRAEFWVPQARRLVKKIVDRCFICRKASASPFHLPPPPPLPKCRVTMSRPFSNLGVDFCGPFTLKRQRKYYVAVFTCAVTRAVHFEALQDLSAESFLLAMKRFIGRRGVPELIISDNAKTFKCVARKLKRIFDNPALQKYFTERRVRWHFYVERAPWHGGFVETCVKLFKVVFKKLIARSKLNYEEFRTMVVETEQVVNSRPLTYLYENPKEGQPLTPSKLILGYNLTDLPPIGRGGLSEKHSITKRAKLLERLLNRFWDEWSECYLNELAERHFSQKQGKEDIREPKKGEMVLLRGEPRMPRNRWKVGVIEEVHKSVRGNRIRSVKVRVPEGKGYKGGEFRRSPKHVVPLEAECD